MARIKSVTLARPLKSSSFCIIEIFIFIKYVFVSSSFSSWVVELGCYQVAYHSHRIKGWTVPQWLFLYFQDVRSGYIPVFVPAFPVCCFPTKYGSRKTGRWTHWRKSPFPTVNRSGRYGFRGRWMLHRISCLYRSAGKERLYLSFSVLVPVPYGYGGFHHCADRPAGTLFQVLVLNVFCGFLDVSLDGFVTYRLTQRGWFERVALFFPFVIGCRIDNAVIGFAVHFPFHFFCLYIIYR